MWCSCRLYSMVSPHITGGERLMARACIVAQASNARPPGVGLLWWSLQNKFGNIINVVSRLGLWDIIPNDTGSLQISFKKKKINCMRNTVRWGFECTFSIYISSARVSTITIQSKVEMLIGWVVGNLVLFRRFSVYSFSGLSKERGLKKRRDSVFSFSWLGCQFDSRDPRFTGRS